MAYGRVNVGGFSGLQIEEMNIIKGRMSYKYTIDIKVPEYDMNKTIFLITSSSVNQARESYSTIKITPVDSTTINLINNEFGDHIDYVIQMIKLKNFKSLHQFNFSIQQGTQETLTIGKNIDINKCLIFKSMRANNPDNKPISMICIKEELIKDVDNTVKLILTSSGTPSERYLYASCYYYVLELK